MPAAAAAAVALLPPTAKLYVLSVGVARYQHADINGLDLPAKDATDFAAADVSEADAGLATPEAVVTLSIGAEPEEPTDAPAAADVDGGVAAPAPAAEPAAPAAPPAVVETIVIELGGAAPGDGQIYVRLRGQPTIYTISRYTSDRLRGEPTLFQDPEPGAAPEEGAEDPDALGMPGLEGMPGAGGQQIPEELMRQIQEQMRQQGMGGHGH